MSPWLLAIRPKTLSLSVTPVAVGSALAWSQAGLIHWGALAAALLAAVLIQIGTNLHNDAADFARGTDGPDRLGPQRAVAQGWLTAAAVNRGALACFGGAFILGIYLVWLGGWPIVAIGLASLGAGWAYTGGPRPLAYSPSGELFVFLFFGLAAVLGTYWLHAGMPDGTAFAVASAIGLHAAAVLLVNNHRDRESDRRAGRRTLAILLGQMGSRIFYGLLLLAPFALTLALPTPFWRDLLPWIALPYAVFLWWRFCSEPIGPGLNTVLAGTARLQALFGLLLIIALLR